MGRDGGVRESEENQERQERRQEGPEGLAERSECRAEEACQGPGGGLRTSLRLRWERIRLQCGRPGSDPWVGKNHERRERLPTPAFWPGEFQGLHSLQGCRESDTRLTTFTFPLSMPLLG